MADDVTRALAQVHATTDRVRARAISGPDAGRSVLVDRPILVGTSDVCELRLTDPTVSRRQMAIEPSAVGVRIRDLGSKNGTWQGDAVRLHDAEVGVSCEIRVGGTVLRLEKGSAEAGAAETTAAPPARTGFGRFRGEALCLGPMYMQLERAAASGATILLEGESGTGKELLAEAIHEHGDRPQGPFVVVDCGAVPENLIESELFGHERGAFTGAQQRRIGAFEAASGGTVFLDEIGELPMSLQTRLLRALDRRQIRRVGGNETIEVDVRVIAATNRNLDREVEQSRFRVDLFHRLAVVLVRVPPLREREGDVERLARHFAASWGASADVLGPDVLARMRSHAWPGNVRELRNFVERLVLLGDMAALEPVSSGKDRMQAAASSGLAYRRARAMALEAFTLAYASDMLARHGGNVSQAARAAGIARRHFQRLKQRDGG